MTLFYPRKFKWVNGRRAFLQRSFRQRYHVYTWYEGTMSELRISKGTAFTMDQLRRLHP